MRIVALGASGNAGREVAVLLGPVLTASDDLVLAGRDPAKLARTAGAVTSPATVTTARVDVTDLDAVRDLVAGANLVVVTVSRPDLVADLARIVLDAGADWFDTMLSTPGKLAALRALAGEIVGKRRCFVTDGGFHPGLPAVLVRWAAGRLDEVIEADVVAAMRMDWRADTLADSTVAEMFDEFADFDLVAWVDGRPRRLRWRECPTVDFGPPIGRKACVPMPLAEMDALPRRYPGLRRCGFYIGGFGPAMDYLVLPVLMAMAKVQALRPAAIRLARWSFRRLASYPPPHRLVVRLDATGSRDGHPATASISVQGEDGYLLTAAPAVACLRGMLDGSVRRPGLHLQAHLVDPEPFLRDLTAFGLEVAGDVTSGV
nr:saccharopine dehydrogenase NADP-binding domain-containing protein [Propionicimonas sp.]